MARARSSLRPPFLKRATVLPERIRQGEFPFDRLPFLADEEFALEFTASVTILVGENGSGKSTLLEALARAAGFPTLGGSHDHLTGDAPGTGGALAEALRLSWLPKVSRGFFFRAESFFGVASYLDEVADAGRHGGRLLHRQSHGESFLALFRHRLDGAERTLYLLDEPEVALSPTRQLAFLRILRQWRDSGCVQAIIATHSPILMSLPGAVVLSLDGGLVRPMAWQDTEHVRVMRSFLADPEGALWELFQEDD